MTIPETTADLSIAELADRTMKRYCAGMTREDKEVVTSEIKNITGGAANYRAVADDTVLRQIYKRFKNVPGDALTSGDQGV